MNHTLFQVSVVVFLTWFSRKHASACLCRCTIVSVWCWGVCKFHVTVLLWFSPHKLLMLVCLCRPPRRRGHYVCNVIESSGCCFCVHLFFLCLLFLFFFCFLIPFFLPFFFFFLCLNEHSSVTELYNCIAVLASVCVEGGSGFL